ncbi:MAG: SgcJ/EcaC family oxidoreductase [Candidatus Eisenbacteria bacterium]
MSTDEEQIRQLIETWHSASRAGDVDSILGLMTGDATFLIPGRPPMRKAEFEALSRVPPGTERPQIRSSAEIHEVQVAGDLAYAWSTLSVAVTPPGAAAPMEREGHTLSIFRRVAGRWLLARDANLLAPVQREHT